MSKSIRVSCESVRRVIEFAISIGFEVAKAQNNHWKFTKPGRPLVWFSSTPGDRRAMLNGISKLRRADMQAA